MPRIAFRRAALLLAVFFALLCGGRFLLSPNDARGEAANGDGELEAGYRPISGAFEAPAGPVGEYSPTSASEAVVSAQSSEKIFGSDDRIPIADTTLSPWRSIAHLAIFDAGGQIEGFCTGSMLSYNVVLTAAHCVYDREARTTATRIVVVPGENPGAFPFGVANASRYSFPQGFADSGGSRYDFALIHLDGAPFGNLTGPYLTVAAVNDAYMNGPDVVITTAGYPGDKPLGSMWFAAAFTYLPLPDTIATQMDAYPGQSGSPIYTFNPVAGELYVVGVFSQETAIANIAGRITPLMLAALQSYCVTGGCSFQSLDRTGAVAAPAPSATPTSTPTPTATATARPSATPTSVSASTATATGTARSPTPVATASAGNSRPFTARLPGVASDH